VDNIDATAVLLKRIKPQDFKNISFKEWKGLSVNLPVYSITNNDDYVKKSIISQKTTITTRKSILIPAFFYLTPGKPLSLNPSN
jgi:hypothetical protein